MHDLLIYIIIQHLLICFVKKKNIWAEDWIKKNDELIQRETRKRENQ